jgi:hypothetical protein
MVRFAGGHRDEPSICAEAPHERITFFLLLEHDRQRLPKTRVRPARKEARRLRCPHQCAEVGAPLLRCLVSRLTSGARSRRDVHGSAPPEL